MKLNKYILICSIIILFATLSIFLYINVIIDKNINKNEKVLDTFNNIFLKENLDVSLEKINNLPKLQIEDTDYIGIISIPKASLSIPVESKCNSSFINIQSLCNYSNNSLVVLGTNLKDSFSSYKMYDIDDTIMFTNMLGQTFQYKIKNIKRINELNDFLQYNEDFIIAIKNYYDMEYVLFICESY